ncbi:hypothetical protein JOQ06_002495, partial [Pogonophryne albipinna]
PKTHTDRQWEDSAVTFNPSWAPSELASAGPKEVNKELFQSDVRNRVPKVYQLLLSLTSSPYTREVCAKGKREESDLSIERHSCPRIPLCYGCQTPTDGKSAYAQHASTGRINTDL